jgi:cytochrome c oxidase subunit II
MNQFFHDALGLPPQASSVAHGIDVLHYVVISSAFLVAFISFALIAVALIRFRAGANRPRKPLKLGLARELGLATFTLVVFVAFWVVGFSQYRELRTPPKDSLHIYVVAKQWMWQAVYPDGTTVEDDIRVPVGQPVELVMTSRDVIHSFYVPAFRVKQDVVPGRSTTLWFTAVQPGAYDILCAEYCGAGHSKMRGRVIALRPDAYQRWLAGHDAPDLAAQGEKIAAERGCFRCHTVDGSPHIAPTWKGLYGSRVRLMSGETVVADPAYLTESMMDPSAKIVAGFPPIMPSYFGFMNGADTAAIVEYIRSLEAR